MECGRPGGNTIFKGLSDDVGGASQRRGVRVGVLIGLVWRLYSWLMAGGCRSFALLCRRSAAGNGQVVREGRASCGWKKGALKRSFSDY